MAEIQKSGEPTPVEEGPLQEHKAQNLSGKKEEQVKVEIVEVDTNSPELFTRDLLQDSNTRSDHELQVKTHDLNNAQQEGVAGVSIIDDSHLPFMPRTVQEWEEASIDMDHVTLPLLSSFDDLSIPDAGLSITGSEPQVKAYAMLQFDDGPFYMQTFAVELGRDVKAAKDALQQEFEDVPDQDFHSASKSRSKSRANSRRSPNKRKREYPKVARSVISESGGILNYDPEAPNKPSKGRHHRTKSGGSASQPTSRSNSIMDLAMDTVVVKPSDLMYSSNSDLPRALSPQSNLPSPQECPLIPIHPPVAEDGSSAGHKGISRRHVKIEYNFNKKCFEMTVKGRNGAFVEDVHYQCDEVVELTSGCYIQIGGVNFRFILPNVPEWETGSGISYDFEHNRGERLPMVSGSSTASSVIDDLDSPVQQIQLQDSDSDSNEDDSEEELEQVLPRKSTSGKKHPQKGKKAGRSEPSRPPKIKLSLKTGSKEKREAGPKSPQDAKSPSVEVDEETLKKMGIEIPLAMIPPRRKGPGRPPKNGFMSKREEASLKKQAREAAKAQAVADGTLPPEALLEPMDGSGKRRSSKKENGKEIHESIEGDDGISLLARLPKEKKTPKPPKSPSPFVDPTTLTAEQLAKPQHSYVVMIHEALSSCTAGQMSLPQIYKVIERKYPYFKYVVTTPGWQSSIRHNLSQHPAFKKTETREGKGWMWCLDPEVSIEKEKRPRRPTPPPMTQQPYTPQAGYLYRSAFPYQGMPQASISGATPVNFPHATTNSTATPVQTSDGSSTAVSNPSGAPGSYQSPYGPHSGRGDPALAAGSPSNPRTAGATPYLQAQNMHRPAQTSPLSGSTTQAATSTMPQFNTGPGVPQLSAQAINAINKYKDALMGSLPMPNREILINTVIDKVLGRPVAEFANITDRTAAAAIEKPLVGLLQQVREGELAAGRQRLAQSSAAQGTPTSATKPAQATQQSGSGPAATPKPAQSETQNLVSTIGKHAESEAPPASATLVESGSPDDTAVPSSSDKTQQAEPQQAPLSKDTKQSNSKIEASTSKDVANPKSQTSEIAPSGTIKQENGQKQFLSILSQLGPSSSASATSTTGMHGTRSLKRALDEESKDAPARNSSMEQPRAAKRVAV